MAYQLKKIFSNNPFLDHIVYQSKYIALNCVCKDINKANKYETAETARNFDIYLACTRNPDWFLFDSIPYEVIKKAIGHKYSDRQIRRIYVPYKDNIPEEDRPAVLAEMAKYYIEHFEEKNDYYREVMGYRPSYSKERILLEDYGFENDLVAHQRNKAGYGRFQYTYLDELPDSILYNLITNGTIQKIINDYPDEKWVAHIPMRIDTSEDGSDTLSLYMVRHAEEFDLLYMPSDADEIIREQFAERYELNQDYILGNVYSEAMKIGSEDYYDNFMQILIITCTMLDMFDTVQDHIVRRDIFDARCIEYIFEQYNVPYYSEIPIRYQQAMLKNLNTLVKFKSTARCMIDLCSLFGFESSQIFQFYLLRKRKMNENGDYIFNYKTITVPNDVEEVVKQSSVYTISNTTKIFITINPPIVNFYEDVNHKILVFFNGDLVDPSLYDVDEENNRIIFHNSNDVNEEDITLEYVYTNPDGTDIKQAVQEVLVSELGLELGSADPVYIKIEFPNGYTNAEIKGISVFRDGEELDDIYWTTVDGLLMIVHTNLLYDTYKVVINSTWRDLNYIDLIRKKEGAESQTTTNHIIAIEYPIDHFGDDESDKIVVTTENGKVSPDDYVISGNKIFFIGEDILRNNDKIILIFQHGTDPIQEYTIEYYTRNILKTYVILNYPVENYFSSGNKIEVWINGQLLPEQYYSVYDDKLYIEDENILQNLYNNSEEEINIPDHSIIISDESMIYTSSQSIYNLHPPVENYFDLGGYIFVILGTLLLHEDCYDILPESNQIFIHTDVLNHYKFTKDMKILYMYSEAIDLKKKDVDVISTQKGQTSFIIPEPFEGYYEAGGRFFLSTGGGYIHESRYHVEGNTLIFNSPSDGLPEGKTLTFHFIYNLFSNVGIKYENVTLTATSNHQTTFTIPLPYENYIADGNPIFVKIRGSYLDPQFYEILKNQIVLHNNYSLYPGAILELEFVYGTIKEIKHTMVAVKATITVQQDFNIPFPYDGFLVRGNKLRVRYKGVEYREGVDYIIKCNMLEIFSVAKAIPKDGILEFHFYTNVNNENHVTVSEAQVKMYTDDQTRFSIPVPFYNYFNTGNRMIVTLGGLFVSSDTYQLVDNRLEFTDPSVIGLIKDRELNFTFIYHTIYLQYNKQVTIDYDTYSVAEEKGREDGSLKIKIPFPFENYLELGNTFEMRVDGITLIPEEAYDVIDNEYAIIFKPDIYVYPYGDTIQFVFTYSSNGYEEKVVEDLEKDVELKFVKVPILENPDNYLKDESNYVDYDTITNADPSWDGDYLHEEVKETLIDSEFSYNRTKYFGLTSLMSMGKLAYQLPYFMNIIFDKFKTEERLKLRLPYINTGHQFRFNDVLTYMMALSHRFIGVEDDIPTIQKSLYVHGFNFETDLATISAHIQDKLGNDGGLNNYKISDKYKQFKKYEHQIPTYKELIDLYTTNTDIYNHVVDEMVNAENKIIYDIYKKIYDSLMIIKYSKQYFAINREVQPTLTAWLRYRDEFLYDSLLQVDAITEEEERKKTISTYLEDCVYQLKEYLDSEDFRYILGSFHGVDKDAILKYLATVIDFFKSYKIQIYDTAIKYVFDDKLENTIRPIDLAIYYSTFDVEADGHTIFDTIVDMWSRWTHKEKITHDIIKEQIKLIIKQYLKIDIKEKINIIDYIKRALITMMLKDTVDIEDLIKLLIQFSIRDNYDSCIDLINSLSFMAPEDKVEVIEKISTVIKQYAQLKKEDMYKLHDEISNIFVNIDLKDKLDVVEELYERVSIVLNDIHADPEDRVFATLSTMTFYDFDETKDNVKVLATIYKQDKYKDKYEILSDLAKLLSKTSPKDRYDILDGAITTTLLNLRDSNIDIMDSMGEYYSYFDSKDSFELKEDIKKLIFEYINTPVDDRLDINSYIGSLRSKITTSDKLNILLKAIVKTTLEIYDNAIRNYDRLVYNVSFTTEDKNNIREKLSVICNTTICKQYMDRIATENEIVSILNTYKITEKIASIKEQIRLATILDSKEKISIPEIFSMSISSSFRDDITVSDIPNIFKKIFDTKEVSDSINIRDNAIVKTFG